MVKKVRFMSAIAGVLLFGTLSPCAFEGVVDITEYATRQKLLSLVGTYANDSRYDSGLMVSIAIENNRLVISLAEAGQPNGFSAGYEITPGKKLLKIVHPMIGRATEQSEVSVGNGLFLNKRLSTGPVFTVEEFLNVSFDEEVLELRFQRRVYRKKYLVGGQLVLDTESQFSKENNIRETLFLEKISTIPLTGEELEARVAKTGTVLSEDPKRESTQLTKASVIPFRTNTCRSLFQQK